MEVLAASSVCSASFGKAPVPLPAQQHYYTYTTTPTHLESLCLHRHDRDLMSAASTACLQNHLHLLATMRTHL